MASVSAAQIKWRPPEWMRETSAIARFAESAGIARDDYASLHGWSISRPGEFWSHLWDFAAIVGEKGGAAYVPDALAPMTGARFFPEASLNIVETLLREEDETGIAVVETDETGASREVSRAELRAAVARCAAGLRAAGVVAGDRVGVILPNRLECLVTFLASLAIGAVWTSCSPDFGTAAILDRIGQVRPRVLIAQPQVRYAGKPVDISGPLSQVAAMMAGLERLVLVGPGEVETDLAVTAWEDFGTHAPLAYARLPFDAPAYILYSSGTTGAPKAIVHRAGGVLLQKVKEHLLHNDVRPGDRFLWYTNTAWMMYHWVVGVLACRATLVLYDGAPVLKGKDGLDCDPLWREVERQRLTHLGISPRYLAAVAEAGYRPGRRRDLSSLRWLLSAGSPVAASQYDWIYEAVKPDLGFASISGGTEIMGCFLLGSPLHPVRRGKLSARALGLAVNVFDERGAPVLERPGELVCTEPFPSMPLTFWGEDGDERYRKTYFEPRPEIWTHGDHAELHVDGSAVIHGRSDSTLNPGGVRIGTADIYNVCDKIAGIEDCVVFGRPLGDDEEIVLCVKMQEGRDLDASLAATIRNDLRRQCSPRHVPAAIYAVGAIPYTVNGKRVETAVRAVATGREVKNLGSIANAACLGEYETLSSREAL
ncbi:acetoacetate--CoA ligase [Jiella sonneratiae]|uniref:Acetoacetate--CoA ligase n=1 Tax=Jiella sonneratiae TaxID=2816856 RepID=A0ABS3J3L3_9HYPH|nr:acetoacetate--CoA ligase [Jiella sonneratiae]MBO0904254.1 acetoacetate--CoA ligase [Jiella sonneratiae]